MKAINISFQLLADSKEMGINDMSPLKLQKLLYLAYEEYTKETGEKLFDDRFEVWRHGPVVREVYDYFKSYASDVIDEEITEKIDDVKIREVFKKVLTNFGYFNAWTLVDITHDVKGLWHKKMSSGEKYIYFEDVYSYVTQ